MFHKERMITEINAADILNKIRTLLDLVVFGACHQEDVTSG